VLGVAGEEPQGHLQAAAAGVQQGEPGVGVDFAGREPGGDFAEDGLCSGVCCAETLRMA